MKKEARKLVIGYLLTVIISWVVWCIVNISNYANLSGYKLWGIIFQDFVENALEVVLLYAFSIMSCRVLIRHLDSHRSRFVFMAVVTTIHVLINVCFALAVAYLYSLIIPFEKDVFIHVLLSDFIVVELFSTIYITLFLVRKSNEQELRRAQAEAESRKNEMLALQTKLDMLALQTNNHFIFNSFSTAAGLVRHDSETAESFIKRLSSMYRFLASNGNAHVVSLMEELEFVDDYIHMLECRYTGIYARISPDIRLIHAYVPPAAIQTLIENAVKHNTHGPEHRLEIDVTLNDGSITVTNNMTRRYDEAPSTHSGLANLKKRYELLTDRAISVENDGIMFKVTLPLIFEEDLRYEGNDN